MKLELFAVRDRATDQFGNPMFLVTAGQAIRSFSDEVNRKSDDNQLYVHSEDFDLYRLGFYETKSGIFETGVPEMVAIGKNVRIEQ